MRPSARTLLVVVLLLVAVGVPFASWFVSGSHEAERESQRVVEEARREARAAARAMAGQLGARLERIRASESQRPYFHYQNLFHDPRGASQGLSVVPSPLAGGPTEPLIQAHFQIDRHGRVSMPTLNDEVSELNTYDATGQRAMRAALSGAAPQLLRAGGPALASLETQVAQRRKNNEPVQIAQQNAPPEPLPEPKEKAAPKEAVKVQRLDPYAFMQNTQANIVFNELKTTPREAPHVRAKVPTPRAPEVEIATSDFAWTTAEVSGHRALAALRPVVTPDGPFVQGFLVSTAALKDAIASAGPAARYLNLVDAADGAARVANTGWSIEADEDAASASAISRADGVRRAFRRTFYAGLAAAGLAILAVTMLVWRTERLARERAQFAAAAAHELRTPLAGLRLYGDMLAHQLGDPDRSRLYAQQVAQEADRLGRVVANMLEFTRLERGALTVKPQEGDLGGAVRECIEQLRPALENAGCPVTITVGDDLPAVAFDRDAIHHIVQNLVDNAEKYSRSSAERTIDVEVARMNGGAGVVVSDRGAGIDARTARHLFLPFERGTGGDAPAGLGLGLVLVRALARAHGGEVSWAARNGGGTTFLVVLPGAA